MYNGRSLQTIKYRASDDISDLRPYTRSRYCALEYAAVDQYVGRRNEEVEAKAHYREGQDNPADLLSRGVTAEQLKIMDVWWCGPSWLAQPPRHWPQNPPPVDVFLPEGKGSANHTLSVEVPQKLLDPTKYSPIRPLPNGGTVQGRTARLGPKLKVGDIVLLQEERMPRQMWKKARIDELIPGRDAQFRTVKLRLPDRTKISRPVQLVIPPGD